MHRQGGHGNTRFQRVLTPSRPDYHVDLTADSEDTITGPQPALSIQASHGAIHVPQCPRTRLPGR